MNISVKSCFSRAVSKKPSRIYWITPCHSTILTEHNHQSSVLTLNYGWIVGLCGVDKGNAPAWAGGKRNKPALVPGIARHDGRHCIDDLGSLSCPIQIAELRISPLPRPYKAEACRNLGAIIKNRWPACGQAHPECVHARRGMSPHLMVCVVFKISAVLRLFNQDAANDEGALVGCCHEPRTRCGHGPCERSRAIQMRQPSRNIALKCSSATSQPAIPQQRPAQFKAAAWLERTHPVHPPPRAKQPDAQEINGLNLRRRFAADIQPASGLARHGAIGISVREVWGAKGVKKAGLAITLPAGTTVFSVGELKVVHATRPGLGAGRDCCRSRVNRQGSAVDNGQ